MGAAEKRHTIRMKVFEVMNGIRDLEGEGTTVLAKFFELMELVDPKLFGPTAAPTRTEPDE